jgi:hypothetical protein
VDGIDLFQVPADEVVDALSARLGPGKRDPREYEHRWPEHRFSLWRIPEPDDDSEEFRGGLYWTAAFSWTDAFAREAERRAAVRRSR